MKKLHCVIAVTWVCLISSCSTAPIDTDDNLFVSAEGTEDIETVDTSDNAVSIETQILNLVNEHRTALVKHTLTLNVIVDSYANAHTNYMIEKGRISHDNFAERASSISQRVNASAVAENVASNYDTASEVVESWLASSEHRAAIEGDYTHTAVSVKEDKNGDFFFTQLFYR